MPTLEERVISGKGIVKMPLNSKDYTQAKIITVYCTVVRRATSEYLNFAYNPARSRYCTLNFMRKGHVIMSASMEFGFQSWDFYPEISAQTLYAVECAYAGILQTFVNLGNALALIPYVVANNIEDWVHTNLLFDEIKVVCYADTAVRISVRSSKFNLCPDQEEKEPDDPPPPPPNPPPVPPGTPLTDTDTPLSEPYDGEDDDGDTVPHPIDEVPPVPEFPQGERCVKYYVYVSCRTATSNFPVTTTAQLFGEIEDIFLSEDNTQVKVTCYGEWATPFVFCPDSLQDKLVLSASEGFNPDTLEYTITPY